MFARDNRTMTSGWQGTSYFRRYGLNLVSEPVVSLKKSWGGYRRTTRVVGGSPVEELMRATIRYDTIQYDTVRYDTI